MRFKILFITLAVFMLITSAAFAQNPVGGTTYNFSSKSMGMSVGNEVSDSCTRQRLDAYAVNQVVKSDPGRPDYMNLVSVQYTSKNYCTNQETILYGFAEFGDGLVVDSKLGSATLGVDVVFHDYVNNTDKDGHLTLALTAYEGVQRVNDHISYVAPGYRFTSRAIGTSRYGSGTGTLTVDNTTVTMMIYGSVFNYNNGSVNVFKPQHP